MRNTFTLEQVQDTKTYKALEAKKEVAKMNFLEERNARARMYHAYLVHRNTGIIPTTVQGMYLEVVKDFIEIDNINVNLD